MQCFEKYVTHDIKCVYGVHKIEKRNFQMDDLNNNKVQTLERHRLQRKLRQNMESFVKNTDKIN